MRPEDIELSRRYADILRVRGNAERTIDNYIYSLKDFAAFLGERPLASATAGDIIRDFVAGKPIAPGQPQSGPASYHGVRDPRVNHIDWSDPRERIRNIVRALAPPLPGAFSLVAGAPLVIARVDPIEAPARARQKTPGMVEVGSANTPIVWARDGAVRLTAVMVDETAEPGSVLIETGRLREGQVLD